MSKRVFSRFSQVDLPWASLAAVSLTWGCTYDLQERVDEREAAAAEEASIEEADDGSTPPSGGAADSTQAGTSTGTTTGTETGSSTGTSSGTTTGTTSTEVVPSPDHPAGVLDLQNWKLELPVLDPNDLTDNLEVTWPEIAAYEYEPYFIKSADDTVVFSAPALALGTTDNSKYPRSELRELNDNGTKAAWSTSSGFHSMEIEQRVVDAPHNKQDVVAGQIHDDGDDVIMIRYEGEADDRLFVETASKDYTLDSDYTLGTWFTVRVEASDGQIRVYYNDESTPSVSMSGSCVGGCYFKAGCYTQSNSTEESSTESKGTVEIRRLEVTHQ